MTQALEVALRCDALLGETPVWDPTAQVLYWVDILGNAVHRYDPATGSDSSFATSAPVGCIALCGDGLVMAIGDHIATSRSDGSGFQWGSRVSAREGIRFNDGRVDAQGRFYVGTMDVRESNPIGALHVVDGGGAVRTALDSVVVSNGLDFSDDGTLLYHIDSPTQGVDLYVVDPATGSLSNRRRLFDVDPKLGEPDGLVLDREGCLWISFWGGARVVRFDQVGTKLREIALPVSQPTGITFGGANLSQLYITSAREGLNRTELGKQPLAGSLFIFPAGVEGRPTNSFRASGVAGVPA